MAEAALDLQPIGDEKLDLQPVAEESPARTAPDIADKINLLGEPRGGFGEFWKGLDITSLPRDVLENLTPVTGTVRHLVSSYRAAHDVITGEKTMAEAVKDYFPESQALVGIEKKPIRERLATGINTVMQLIFAKQVAEGIPSGRAETISL